MTVATDEAALRAEQSLNEPVAPSSIAVELCAAVAQGMQASMHPVVFAVIL
jgi:hypothetical protein